jgi:hypothetical protein
MSRTEQPWSVPISVKDVPEAGLRVELDANERTRLALARVAGVEGMDRLKAVFDLARHGRDGVRAVGQVLAVVAQTCVVSLEPLVNEIVEEVDLLFSPNARPQELRPGSTFLDIILTADEAPEPLVDGVIDLGAVATEFLILGIDPYPRKPGVVFEASSEPESGNRPFAALAGLNRKTSRQ